MNRLFCLLLFGTLNAQIDTKTFENAFQDGRKTYGTIESRLKLHRIPGLSIALIQNGTLHWSKGYGLAEAGQEVNGDTLFSVGSVSKLMTAVSVLRLVELGELDLQTDVNQYLTLWQVPENAFTKERSVTLVDILSHTAGFTVHGFRDFQPGETLPTTVEILLGKPPAKNAPVLVDFLPGSKYRYSGGGTTVCQLILEEKLGKSFEEAVAETSFQPLNMRRSTFENPLPASWENIAKAHGPDGKLRALPRGWEAMPEKAASGFWTCSKDLAKVLIMLHQAYHAKHDFLSQDLVKQMMTPVGPSKFGLGPVIEGDLIGHGGSNESYKAQVKIHLKTGNGIVILTNSANGKTMINEILKTMSKLENW